MEELKKQIAAWHELDDHQAIVDALEKIPATERDFEMTGLLARAYNNLEEYAKAVELLESVREEGESDYLWNFRMGYALYYMDYRNWSKETIGYFKKAQELNQGDEDAQDFIRCINRDLPFRKRVEDFWEWFLANEHKLSDMLQARNEEEADNFVEFIGEGTNLISEDVHFNMGGDHEFTFSVEGWPDLFILYSYVVSRMPDSLKGRWNFFPFNQGQRKPFRFKMNDIDVDMQAVQVAASYQEDTNDFILTYYEQNLCALPEDKSGNAFYIMADIMLGEGVTFQYIKTVEKAEKPQEGMIALPELRKHIEETLQAHDKKFIENPKDVYTTYKFAPQEAEDELPLRYDVIIGSTSLNSLVAEYYQNVTELFDHINSFGAQAVYIKFQHNNGKEEEGNGILNVRHDLEDRINDEILIPEGLGQLLGGATGTKNSYIDLIVFDFNLFVEKVRVLLQEYPQYSFYLSDFRQNCGLIRLAEAAEEEEESLVYAQEHEEAFFKQIEEWNEKDEHTKCIKALEAIPENLRNYKTIMMLVRAYENYAIIGDHDKGTERYKGDKALHKALELMESVREEGKDQAYWNMRMAYAYQYLYEQEENAISYAQRWAELDPNDNTPQQVIEECLEEIEKRKSTINDDGEEGVSEKAGMFCGSALLSENSWDKKKYVKDLKEQWGIIAEEDKEDVTGSDSLIFNVGDMMAAVSLMPAPVPNDEATECAKNNYMWPEAVETAQNHKAHIIVAIIGKEGSLMERGKLYTKLMAVCCLQENVTGIYTSGVVFQPRFYEEFAKMMKEDELPIYNWIWFGLYRSEKGISGYTYGMDLFGKNEMEVLDADASPSDVRDFLSSMVSYVLEYDVTLNDGETIGFSADEKHEITFSQGVALPEQMTLKISY